MLFRPLLRTLSMFRARSSGDFTTSWFVCMITSPGLMPRPAASLRSSTLETKMPPMVSPILYLSLRPSESGNSVSPSTVDGGGEVDGGTASIASGGVAGSGAGASAAQGTRTVLPIWGT
jgi:hypothetical protein